MKKTPLLAGLLVTSSLLGACPGGITNLEGFGHGQMRTGTNTPAVGERPLIVVIFNAPESELSAGHRDAAFYDRLVFGSSQQTGELNVADYFSEVSQNLFTWRRALPQGVIGPFNFDNSIGDTATNEGRLAQIVHQAAAAGIDFEALDTNHDGTVDNGEAGFAMTDNYSAEGAAVRWGGCTNVPGQHVRVCANLAMIGYAASFATWAHELSHELGTFDVYGPVCNGYAATLMSCTIVGANDYRDTYHLDPWHKMMLGWVDPRVTETTSEGGCFALDAPSAADEAQSRAPMIMTTPEHGTSDYFMLEYRNWNASTARPYYDHNVSDAGVAVWRVSTGDDYWIDQIRRPDVVDGWEASLLTEGAPNHGRGGNTFWRFDDGTIPLQWIDGTESGIVIRSGIPMDNRTVEVEWGTGGKLPVPHVTKVELAGNRLTATGMFGVGQRGREISVHRIFNGQETDVTSSLFVQNWTCGQVTLAPRDSSQALAQGNYVMTIGEETGIESQSFPLTLPTLPRNPAPLQMTE